MGGLPRSNFEASVLRQNSGLSWRFSRLEITDPDALLAAIQSALANSPQATEEDPERERIRSVLDGLSPRETEVLEGVVEGKLNKVIAHELGISPRTVEVYRANVMSKTGARGLSELIRMVLLARG